MTDERAKELNQMYRSGYLAGLEEGIRRYAIWSDGEQRVGCMRTPLKKVLEQLPSESVICPFEEAGR